MEDREILRIEDRGGPNFLDYWKVIWRKKWLVLTMAVAVFGVSTWRTLRQEPVYEAAATMQLGSATGPAVLERVGSFMSLPGGLETEMEILRSRIVAEKTAIRLQGHYELKTVPPGVSVVLRGVAVGDEARPGLYTIDLTDASGNYQVKDPTARVVGVGQLDQPFKAGDLSFTISAKPAPGQGSSFQVLVRNPTAIANSLRGRLSVALVRGTSIVSLKTRANDAIEASRITNAFAETYVDFSREQSLQHVLTVRGFIEEQIKTFRQEMIKMQEEFAEKTPSSRLGPVGVRTDRDLEMSADDPRSILARRLFDLELQRATLQYTLTPDHRVVVQLDREIATIRSRLAGEFRQTRHDMELQDLLRESRIKISMYNYLLQRQQEARLAEASELGSARIIDRALTPTAPISPDVQRSVKFGGFLGLSLGVGLALLLGCLDRSIRNIKDIEDRLGLRVFAAIPEIRCEDRRNRLRLWSRTRESTDPARYLLGGNGTEARVVEAYRTLRTHIRQSLLSASSPAFLFTSVAPGDGKSLTLANLAIAMSQKGARILIVDCDLRKPDQSKLFKLGQQAGISEVLAGKRLWREVTQPTRFENIDVLPCGDIPPDPPELIAGHAMKEFLQEAQQDYSLVLIDSPPILPFTDACVLAPLVGRVLVVVRSGSTTTESITRAQSMLGAVQGGLIAVILNRVPWSDVSRDYGYYGYYNYHGEPGKSHSRSKGLVPKVAQRMLRNLRRD